MDSIQVGAVSLERTAEEVIIRSAKHPDVYVAIPVRVLEAWALRKLREEALQPAGKCA